MPVFRIGAKICFFAHVPKCGGSSVERYLTERFGALGFYDNGHHWRPVPDRWSRTSPQHVDWASLQFLLPASMLDAVFAVVRHPIARAKSAYQFQLEVERSVPEDVGFPEWLRHVLDERADNQFAVDNHIRPQCDFMPKDCDVFHLEHGLDTIVAYLDQLAGTQDGPRVVGHSNDRRARSSAGKRRGAVADAPTIALIREYYAGDFERFGYSVDQPEPLAKPASAPVQPSARYRVERVERRLLRDSCGRLLRGIARRLG